MFDPRGVPLRSGNLKVGRGENLWAGPVSFVISVTARTIESVEPLPRAFIEVARQQVQT
jgi:hypothetical protein